MSTVGIVIPAYNPNVKQLTTYIEALAEHLAPSSILVELDGANAETIAHLHGTSAIVHAVPERRGKGAAITCGFNHLDTDLIVFVDADGSIPPESLAAILAPLHSGDTDLSVGSRRHPEATIAIPQPYLRRWLGMGFVWLARRLLSVALSDYQCGAKALTRDTWLAVRSDLTEQGFAWDIDLIVTVDAYNGQITEVPIVWNDCAESTVVPLTTAVELVQGLMRVLTSIRRRQNESVTSAKAENSERDVGSARRRLDTPFHGK